VVTGWRDEFVALCGRVIVLGGFWSLVSLILRPVRWIRWIDDLFGLLNLPAGPSLFSTVLLFVVGGAVRRRMRVSLWLLLAFQALAVLDLLGVLLQLALNEDEARAIRPVEAA
jgi:lysyl-tRNA synthetase class 2